MTRKLLGNYIVADSEICHGKPTFISTRIMVWQVLEMVSEGMNWDVISSKWRGKVSREAIAEAVALAKQVFVDHVDEYHLRQVSAPIYLTTLYSRSCANS